MTSIPTVFSARSRVAIAAQTKDPAAEAEARRDLCAANIKRAIEVNVSKAPPLTAEQRRILASLLRGVK